MVRNQNSPIGNRIRELRKDAGLTVKELSEKTGLSASALSNYEYGFREPDSKAMAPWNAFFM